LVDERHRNAERCIHPAELREVGKLVGAGDVTDGWEQRVLDQRPQQHVRAEPLGMLTHAIPQRRGGFRAIADQKAAAVTLDRLARTACDGRIR
jgi:hypothetical protein